MQRVSTSLDTNGVGWVLLLAPARKNSGRQQQPARFLAHRHLAAFDAATKVGGELGGQVECGEMAVREEARGLLLPTAIFARWSKD